jgi:hypothetical protein
VKVFVCCTSDFDLKNAYLTDILGDAVRIV